MTCQTFQGNLSTTCFTGYRSYILLLQTLLFSDFHGERRMFGLSSIPTSIISEFFYDDVKFTLEIEDPQGLSFLSVRLDYSNVS